jgi:LysM repeat protein
VSRYSNVAGFLLALAMLTAVVGLAFMTGIIELPAGGLPGPGTPTPPASSAVPSASPETSTTPMLTPTPEPSPEFTPGGTYIVQPGDTLFSIGLAYGVPWELIAAANQIEAPYILQVGQELVIPVPTEPSPGADTYIVQSGDTIYGIADKLGVDPTALADCNQLVDWNSIQVGQILHVPPSCPTESPSPSPTRR